MYGHHFLGAPHASSFCFSGERRRWRHRWRVLPSLVVLGLPLPLPRLSRRDRLKLGLALCSCYARAHVTCAVLIMCKSPPSPRNIAQLLLLQVLALCRTKTLGNRSLQFSAPSAAAPPKGGYRRWFSNYWGSRTMGLSCAQQKTVRGPRVLHRSGLRLPCRSRGTVAGVCLASPP